MRRQFLLAFLRLQITAATCFSAKIKKCSVSVRHCWLCARVSWCAFCLNHIKLTQSEQKSLRHTNSSSMCVKWLWACVCVCVWLTFLGSIPVGRCFLTGNGFTFRINSAAWTHLYLHTADLEPWHTSQCRPHLHYKSRPAQSCCAFSINEWKVLLWKFFVL